jgi:hypothetical protein
LVDRNKKSPPVKQVNRRVHQTQAALRVHSSQKRRPVGRSISGSDILQYQKRSSCWNPAGIYIADVW